MTATVEDFERQLQARDKTIRVLSERLEQHITDNINGFTLFEQNIVLESVVARRTNELESQRKDLLKALTQLQKTQAELLQAQKMQAIGQLAGGIAHEINTPTQYIGNNIGFIGETFQQLLQTVKSIQQLIEHDNSSRTGDALEEILRQTMMSADVDYIREEIPRALAECMDGVHRIAGIVGAMKDFANPSGGYMQPIDLNAIIISTVEISRNAWNSIAELEIELDPGLPVIEGLKDELGQVFLSLIVNAAHAISDRKLTAETPGKIRVVSIRASDYVEIRIEDNGCGIPASLQEKIFEPFFTTKEIGRGMGQGLAIAYHVVTGKHNGQLLMESDPGRQTTFTVRLPLSRRDSVA